MVIKPKPKSLPDYIDEVLVPHAEARVARGENASTLPRDYRQRNKAYIRPFFGTKALHRIDSANLREFETYLTIKRGLKATSALPIISLVSVALRMADEDRYLIQKPTVRRPKQKTKVRAWFTQDQYRLQLLPALRKIEAGKPAIVWKGKAVDWELRALITFLVNSFLRPGDLFVLKHHHVTIVEEVPATASSEGEHGYLRLNLPPSKDHHAPVITMPVAVPIYKRILERQTAAGFGKPDDYLFLPNRQNRDYAKEIIRRQFDLVLKHVGLKTDELGNVRTLYSFRHSCIMFRLLDAEDLDLITLARTARTSVEVIDRFYAQPMTAEMNRHQLFSTRRPNRSLQVGRAQMEEQL